MTNYVLLATLPLLAGAVESLTDDIAQLGTSLGDWDPANLHEHRQHVYGSLKYIDEENISILGILGQPDAGTSIGQMTMDLTT
jgi:hypothetical protein